MDLFRTLVVAHLPSSWTLPMKRGCGDSQAMLQNYEFHQEFPSKESFFPEDLERAHYRTIPFKINPKIDSVGFIVAVILCQTGKVMPSISPDTSHQRFQISNLHNTKLHNALLQTWQPYIRRACDKYISADKCHSRRFTLFGHKCPTIHRLGIPKTQRFWKCGNAAIASASRRIAATFLQFSGDFCDLCNKTCDFETQPIFLQLRLFVTLSTQGFALLETKCCNFQKRSSKTFELGTHSASSKYVPDQLGVWMSPRTFLSIKDWGDVQLTSNTHGRVQWGRLWAMFVGELKIA